MSYNDTNGVINDFTWNFQLFSVNSLLKLTFRPPILEIIMTALGESNEHPGFRFCWF